MGSLPLSQAVFASASFPISLPPFVLDIQTFPSGTSCPSSFHKPGSIYLSDGGVLENLGVQTLLRSRRFGHWEIIQSDAGALGSEWRGPVCRDQLKSVLIGPLGGWSLQRVMDLMSDEPNPWGVLAAIYPQLDAITASYVLRTLRTLAGTETALPPGTVLDGDAPVLRAHSGSSGATDPAADRPNPCPSGSLPNSWNGQF